jgi:DNA-binding NtrC family response regulator
LAFYLLVYRDQNKLDMPSMKDRKPLGAALADVLIVDADEPSQKSISRVIRRAGFKTTVARNDMEAQHRTARSHFPLIVIDLWQANRAAVSLVQHLRSESPSSKIVVITPYEASRFRSELDGLDVFECLSKPVKRSSLLEVVSRALSAAPSAIA